MNYGDAVRYGLAGLNLLLAGTCGASLAYALTWDQRGRFVVLLGYAMIITSGQLDALGKPLTWRSWALLAVTVAAVITTAAFIVRQAGGVREGSHDGRSSRHKCGFLWPRAAARRARHAGNRAQPPRGGAAP